MNFSNLEWKTVEGFSLPQEIEMTDKSVFLRRNIKTKKNKNFQGKDSTGIHWIYEEAVIPKEKFDEYAIYSIVQMAFKLSEIEYKLFSFEKKLDKALKEK